MTPLSSIQQIDYLDGCGARHSEERIGLPTTPLRLARYQDFFHCQLHVAQLGAECGAAKAENLRCSLLLTVGVLQGARHEETVKVLQRPPNKRPSRRGGSRRGRTRPGLFSFGSSTGWLTNSASLSVATSRRSSAGRKSCKIVAPAETINASRIALCSCRTLPGQSYSSINSIASAEMDCTAVPSCLLKRNKK